MTNHPFTGKLFYMVLTLLVASCGGGGGGDPAGPASPGTDVADGGIGGTGISVEGIITGFGSVFVNGVEYETSPQTEIIVNELAASEGDLRVGMVVRLDGTVNADGLTGNAARIVFDAELKGPIADTPIADAANRVKTFTVLNVPITIVRGETVFDTENNATAFGFDTLNQGDVVEVSGFVENGSLRATHVEKKGASVIGVAVEVSVKGTITQTLNAESFVVNGLTVTFDPQAVEIEDLPEDPASWTGLAVEVEGLLLDGTTLQAQEIEQDDDSYPTNADLINLEGFVTEFVSLTDFTINGQRVDAGNALFSPQTLSSTLAAGTRVEVTGPMVNGVINATRVTARSGQISLEAAVSSVDSNARTVTLLLNSANPPLTISFDNRTLLYDEDENSALTLASLQSGDAIHVDALALASSQVVATSLQRRDQLEAIRIEAPVESVDTSSGTLTLAGVTYRVDAQTQFGEGEEDGEDDAPPSQASFFANLSVGDVVTIEDRIIFDQIGDGIADRLELDD